MKIAIVGTAGFSRKDAPYEDASYDEIWGLGCWSPDVRRYTGWFQIHAFDKLTANEANIKFLLGNDKPIYVQAPHNLVPTGVVYPLEKFKTLFGRDHFTSTAAFAMAQAIVELRPDLSRTKEPRDELGLWGLEMVCKGEYELQRAGVKHFMGICTMLNIEVRLPDGSDLLRGPRIYAFEEETGEERKVRMLKEDAESKLQVLEKQNEQVLFQRGYQSGAIDVLSYLERAL